MPRRQIVEIDQKKCNGCGQCVPACAEGAIAIVDGKARLVADVYCDGLGACLGKCPQGAIRITEREAEAFDEDAVHQHLARQQHAAAGGGCPGAAVRSLGLPLAAQAAGPRPPQPAGGALTNWPIQLQLVPAEAPFLRDADVVLAANCTAFACGEFHEEILRGRPALIACPKLDNSQAHVEKLARVFAMSGMRSLTVVRMEVPCCMGLVRIAAAARRLAGSDVPVREVVVSVSGRVQ